MKRRSFLAGASSLALIGPSRAQVGITFFPGPGMPAASGGGGGFVGPGDIVAGAAHWWGLRGYSAAYAAPGTNPAIDLVDQAGANPITINIKSDGTLDVASIAAWVAAHSVTTIKVTQLFDQINPAGAFNMVQSTLASMPILVLGPVTGLASNRPAMVFSGGQLLAAPTILNQPLTYDAVAFNNGSTVGGIMAGVVAKDAEMIFGNSANSTLIFAGGSPIQVSAADNSWHAIGGTFNGASSIINVDGTTSSPANVGSGTVGSLRLGEDSFGDFLTGNINEARVDAVALSGTDLSSLSSNQHSYWGF